MSLNLFEIVKPNTEAEQSGKSISLVELQCWLASLLNTVPDETDEQDAIAKLRCHHDDFLAKPGNFSRYRKWFATNLAAFPGLTGDYTGSLKINMKPCIVLPLPSAKAMEGSHSLEIGAACCAPVLASCSEERSGDPLHSASTPHLPFPIYNVLIKLILLL